MADGLIGFFIWFEELISIPAVIVFLGSAILLTFKINFLQLTGFKKLFSLLRNGIPRAQVSAGSGAMQTINPFHALFAAMGTTIGMGNLTGPPMAIFVGGPGALFWLLVYIFFSSATKFTEVCFAIHTRTKSEDGQIIGGPMQYLAVVHPYLARWYTIVMLFVFTSWSTVQSNGLANTFALEGVPHWVTGLVVTALTFVVVSGGSQRFGQVASRLVPFMFLFYVSFALYFLFQDMQALRHVLWLIITSIFTPAAALGGVVGSTVYQAMRAGLYKGVFICEAGMGTASIPHSVADVRYPPDQGLLAMYSMASDAILSMISGLLVLITGVWTQGVFRTTLLYEVFALQSPMLGRPVLLITITLFVFTTLIGNTYNGRQVFASLTRFRGVTAYLIVTTLLIFAASLMEARIVWKFMEFLFPFVAIPHLIGLLILAYRYPNVLKVRK